MSTVRPIIFVSLLVCGLLATATAQERNSATGQTRSLTITAAASGEQVRITAPSSIVEMHVEVYAAGGDKLFDQEIRGGNVFDWHLQDGQAQRLSPGTYVCVVTAKSISGKLTRKIGTVQISENSVSVQPADSHQLSAQQTQTIGPMEEDSSWTTPGKDEPQTTTVIAHDGTDGQMIRGRGALTFRVGNFFSGIDTEQMRLTETGNLGIGTSDPKTKLDVAGTIRAERFLVFKPAKPGSANRTTSEDMATAAVDPGQSLISGSGTQDRVAKWTDNAGTLGNSAITETGGLVGIGTPTPTQALEVANGRILASGSQTLAAPGGIIEIGTTVTNNQNQASGIRMRNLFNGNASLQQGLDVAPTFAPSASIALARGFLSAAFFAPQSGVTITDAYGGNAVNVYNNTGGAVTNGTAFAINSPVVFGSLKPTNQFGVHINNQGIAGATNSYGLFVDAQSGSANNYSAIFAGGNVGIGTTNPGTTLDVQNSVGNALIRARSTSGGGGVLFLDRAAAVPSSSSQIGFYTAGGPDFTLGTSQGSAGNSDLSIYNYGTNSNALTILKSNGNVGIDTTDPGTALEVRRDATVASDWQTGQLRISGASNPNMQLSLGYDTSSNLGVIQAGQAFTAFRNLSLNPFGGNVGIGTTSPSAKLHILGSALFQNGGNNGFRITPGSDADAIVLNVTNAANTINWLTVGNQGQVIMNGGNVGIGTLNPLAKLDVQGTVRFASQVTIGFLVAAGGPNIPICLATGGALGSCSSSSLRYKKDIGRFGSGLDVINRLRPISFTWKSDGTRDFGLGAEDVEEVDPNLVFYRDGKIEGVKYDRIGVVLINAVKEQQAQIRQQEEQLSEQQRQLKQQRALIERQILLVNGLRRTVCHQNPRATYCHK